MRKFFQTSKTAGGMLLLGFLLLMLQGCQKPFIEVIVDARAQICEKGAGGDSDGEPTTGCMPRAPRPGDKAVTGESCTDPQGAVCKFFNQPCTGGTCKTIHVSGGKCDCKCQASQ